MNTLPLSNLLDRALAHHQAGRLNEAEPIYREILSRDPRNVDALHLLGLIAHQAGELAIAVELVARAAELAPKNSAIHSNLGEALRLLGRLDEAVARFQHALMLQPDYPEALHNLGLALSAQEKFEPAIENLRRAITLRPTFAEAHNSLGTALQRQGRLDEAVSFFQRALALDPTLAGAWNNLGNIHKDRGRYDAARESFCRALTLAPAVAEFHFNFANLLKDEGELAEAAISLQKALALNPKFADAWLNLGNLLHQRGKLDEARGAYQRALTLNPILPEAYNSLGNYFKDCGDIDEALSHFRKGVELAPHNAAFHSNLIVALHYRFGDNANVLAVELRRWNERHAQPLSGQILSLENDRSPNRRLRVGYISPDFRSHAVGWFLRPLFSVHNRNAVEFFCYSNGRHADHVTAQLASQADSWREIGRLSDRQVADLIQQDRIDILVDLALHTADNRLPVFAYKPAPVQVTYLAYLGSSGLNTMDYRISDVHMDPSDGSEPYGSEEVVRLPETYWCYQPPISVATPNNPPPAFDRGHVTFACLNNPCKVTPAALETWARVLTAVPRSVMRLHAFPGEHTARIRELFRQNGVDPQRIQLADRMSEPNYFESYRTIDIALDPFPYPGGTTTCDALWMGVPVVTLAGPTPITRGGVSLLTNVGLSESIARSTDEYIATAVALAQDLPRLATLRATLRARMEESPLMDASRFARNFEALLLSLWHRWCASPGQSRLLGIRGPKRHTGQ